MVAKKEKLNKADFVKKYALNVFESPLTGNACHVFKYPDAKGRVYVNDLDMGEVYLITLSSVPKMEVFRRVDVSDFQFSWMIDEFDDDLYNRVMDELEVPERLR